jgi:hypothetical protein
MTNTPRPVRRVACLVLLTAAAPLQAQGGRPNGFPATCAPNEVKVLLLGTYHFANPGRDVIKQDIDDVLVPKRQAELEDLASRLAVWKPDRMAVEWPWSRAAPHLWPSALRRAVSDQRFT